MSEAVRRGHDPRVVGEALLAKLRDVFLHRMGDPLVQLSDTARERVVRWSEDFSDRDCTRALEAIGEALREMRQATDARIPLEVALVRLTRAEADTSLEALADRVDRLERGAPSAATAGSAPDAPPRAAPPAAATGGEASSPAEGSPGSGGGRPLDAARAFLAEKAGVRAPEVEHVVGAPPVPLPHRLPRPPRRRHRATQHHRRPPREARSRTGANAQTRVATYAADRTATDADYQGSALHPTPSSSGLPSQEELTIAWADQVLPKLGGLTKAMYAAGRFTDTAGAKAIFAVPNAVHREKSLQKLPEVEAALAAHFGRAVPLELVVEGEQPSAKPAARPDASDRRRLAANAGPPSTARPHSRRPRSDDEIGEIGDPSELADTPVDDRTTVDRVIEAFPGAEVVDP